MGASENGKFTIAPLAERDLEDIWSFTADEWSWEQAQKYHATLLQAFRDLATGRLSGREADIRRGYMKYRVGSHLVFYRHQTIGIEVIRILHRRMDVSRHL